MNSQHLSALIRLARLGMSQMAATHDPRDASNCWGVIAAAEQTAKRMAESESAASTTESSKPGPAPAPKEQ
jgi:hypothetical protein